MGEVPAEAANLKGWKNISHYYILSQIKKSREKSLRPFFVNRHIHQNRSNMGEVPAEAANLKGWAKHFNAFTVYGRRNVVFAVYGSIFGIYLLKKIAFPKKKECCICCVWLHIRYLPFEENSFPQEEVILTIDCCVAVRSRELCCVE